MAQPESKIDRTHKSDNKVHLSPRELFIAALERRPQPGRVPHFELVFYPTMEALGAVHPVHRQFGHQWLQMAESERRAHRKDSARVYLAYAKKYEHSAVFLQIHTLDFDESARMLEAFRELAGDKYFVMAHGDPTIAIPDGQGMTELAVKLSEEPERVEKETCERIEQYTRLAERYRTEGLLDGFALCSDYCFNTGPFISIKMFDRFIAPYLKEIIARYRAMGFHVIKHTDGNIMPILDQLVDANPHALHSLDPQGNVDIAEVVQRVGDRVCLIGNVNCGLLQTGSDEEVIASTRYALREGMRAPGYVFSTSNCIFPGMELARYELIHSIWQREGIRPE